MHTNFIMNETTHEPSIRAELIQRLKAASLALPALGLLQEATQALEADLANEPAEQWRRFIEHLHVVKPLGTKKDPLRHVNFLGGVGTYRSIFIQANQPLKQGKNRDKK